MYSQENSPNESNFLQGFCKLDNVAFSYHHLIDDGCKNGKCVTFKECSSEVYENCLKDAEYKRGNLPLWSGDCHEHDSSDYHEHESGRAR